jgi:hypothetical protein
MPKSGAVIYEAETAGLVNWSYQGRGVQNGFQTSGTTVLGATGAIY